MSPFFWWSDGFSKISPEKPRRRASFHISAGKVYRSVEVVEMMENDRETPRVIWLYKKIYDIYMIYVCSWMVSKERIAELPFFGLDKFWWEIRIRELGRFSQYTHISW